VIATTDNSINQALAHIIVQVQVFISQTNYVIIM